MAKQAEKQTETVSVATQLRELLTKATEADVKEIDDEITKREDELEKLRANRKMLAQAVGLEEPKKVHWTKRKKAEAPPPLREGRRSRWRSTPAGLGMGRRPHTPPQDRVEAPAGCRAVFDGQPQCRDSHQPTGAGEPRRGGEARLVPCESGEHGVADVGWGPRAVVIGRLAPWNRDTRSERGTPTHKRTRRKMAFPRSTSR